VFVARLSPTRAQAQVQLEDGYLIALAKQGSADAYDRLVRRYYSFVRLKASSYFLVGGDAEDLIQEGLVGLYKAIRDFRSDRESSFRNFAELCITRQIITAVKTATRNKHTPLNGYVSFSSTPAGTSGDGEPTLDEVMPGSTVWDPVNQVISAVKTATRNKHTPLNGYVSFSAAPAGAGDSEPTLDEVLPGSTVHDPVNQVISSEELRSLVACLSTVLSELESRVLSLYLDGHSYTAIGEKLDCDCKTVDNALQRVKRKVGAHLNARNVVL
jgi:RNA polymerase sporulation-specific sigma factor